MTTRKYVIEEVEVIPIKPKDGLIGFASLVFEKSFYFGCIGIYTRLGGGYRLTYPIKQAGKGTMNVFHPINPEVSKQLEEAVGNKYEEIMMMSLDMTEE